MLCIILNTLIGIAASAWFDFTGATALAPLYISIGRSDIAAEMVAYFWLCTTYIQSSVLTLLSPEPALKIEWEVGISRAGNYLESSGDGQGICYFPGMRFRNPKESDADLRPGTRLPVDLLFLLPPARFASCVYKRFRRR
ncbi:hypothetical protein B0H13DRAFT_1989145, partial [Mycena leptocephala]